MTFKIKYVIIIKKEVIEIIYFISDTHFYHRAVISYCHRPFASVEEMNETLINNWNKTVKNTDIVYFLGDFSFSNAENNREVCRRLNGHKIMLRGNHDRSGGEIHWKKIGFDEVIDGEQKLYYIDKDCNMRYVVISHEPKYVRSDEFNIHGHIHDALVENDYPSMSPKNHLCVCVERINYTPISFEEIQKEYLEKFFKKEGNE